MKRVAAVDIFRAITMLLMLFVNDFAGMKDIPHWMHHAEMSEDMLGFSDLIFPAFCIRIFKDISISAIKLLSHILFITFTYYILI